MENFLVILSACFAASFASMVAFSRLLLRYQQAQDEFLMANIPRLATMISKYLNDIQKCQQPVEHTKIKIKKLETPKEQQEIADSILDFVYQKLFEANSTKETIRQMMIDSGLENKNWLPRIQRIDWKSGRRYLVGKLLMKITENFLESEKYDLQTCLNAINILINLEENIAPKYLNTSSLNAQEAEYTHSVDGYTVSTYYKMALVSEYAINIVMSKITQNEPKFLKYLRSDKNTPFAEMVARSIIIFRAAQIYPKFKELIESVTPSYKLMNDNLKEFFEIYDHHCRN